MNPLVSIIVPCFNYGHYIVDTINSVLRQNYQDWEMLIIDDGSTDNSKEVCSDFLLKDRRISYFFKSNGGLSSARNYGLNKSKGEYVIFLDADDLISPNKILGHINFMMQGDFDLSYSNVQIFENGNDPFTSAVPFYLPTKKVTGKGEVLIDQLIHDNIFLPHCAVFKKRVLQNNIGFDEELFSIEDWHFWIQLALKGSSFGYLNDETVISYSRKHGTNMSASRKRMWWNFAKARRKVNALLPEKYRSLNQYYINLDLIRFYFMFGNIGQGVKFLFINIISGRNRFFSLREAFYCLRVRLNILSSE